MRTKSTEEEASIRSVIRACFFALDSRDRHYFSAQFTPDATARYHAGSGNEADLSGADQITEYNIGRMESYDYTAHQACNSRISIEGRKATCETHAIAHVVIGERVLVRGLKYVDTLTHSDGRWRIAHRRHQARWQYYAESVQPTVTHPR